MINVGSILGDLGVPTPDDLQQIITGVGAGVGALPPVISATVPDPVGDARKAVNETVTNVENFAVRMGIFVFLITLLLIGIFAVIVPVSDVIDAAQQTGKDAATAATTAAIAG